MNHSKILALVVEDDPAWQQILAEILSDFGLEIDLACDFETALDMMRSRTHRLAIIDLSLEGQDHHNLDGMRVLAALARYDPNCVSLMLTGFATVELAVSAMRDFGALTCLRKEIFRRATFREWLNRALVFNPRFSGEFGPTPKVSTSASQENVSVIRLHEPSGGIPVGRAILVEDDAGWRSLLSELLNDVGYQVTKCSSYVEALGKFRRSAYDLAVVDLSLASSLESTPNQDGYRLLSNPKVTSIPTIIVSGYADPTKIEQAYAEFGIVACLEKQSFSRETFLSTVREAQAQILDSQPIRNLTKREREVLKLLTRGYTNKMIAQYIHVSPNTVKRHLKSIFAKLDVNSRAAATAKAVSAGLAEE